LLIVQEIESALNLRTGTGNFDPQARVP
jgi:hypothetical protein